MNRMLVIGALSILSLNGCSAPDSVSAALAKETMANEVQPTAQIYWNAVQYISDERGTRKIVPTTDAEWEETAKAASKLKQIAQRLGEPDYAANRGSDWLEFAEGMAEVAGQAEAAAKARDPDKVLDAGGTLYNVCSACHEVYVSDSIRLASDPSDAPSP